MKNFFKGFIIGIGKIVPGVSGAMLAIFMGIYDKALYYICNFRCNKKESIKYLFPICIGIILSIIFFSKIISLLFANYYLITMLFFVGLIIGCVPSLIGKVRKEDYYISIISFIIFFLISISNIDNIYVMKNNINDMVIFFLSGILEAIGTVVPGISSTALLMVMGTYNTIITCIGNVSGVSVLIPFGIGFIVGLISVVRIINYLFRWYENMLYAFVLGVLMSSTLLLMIQSFNSSFDFFYLIIGLVLMVVGIFVSCLMDEKK